MPAGNLGPLVYAERRKVWGPTPRTQKTNTVTITATNLSRIVVHPRRARIDCRAKLDVTTDGPVTVAIAGCKRRQRFAQ